MRGKMIRGAINIARSTVGEIQEIMYPRDTAQLATKATTPEKIRKSAKESEKPAWQTKNQLSL